jgi:hypothetical protein
VDCNARRRRRRRNEEEETKKKKEESSALLWNHVYLNSGHKELKYFTFQVLHRLVVVEDMQQEVVQQV